MAGTFESNLYYRNNYSAGAGRKAAGISALGSGRSVNLRSSSRSFVGVHKGLRGNSGRGLFSGGRLRSGGNGIFSGRFGNGRIGISANRPRINRNRAFANTGALVSSTAGGVFKNTVGAFAQAINVAKSLKGGVRKFEVGPGTAMIGMMVFAAVLSLSYLAHFNQVATKGYDLRRLEADRQQLVGQYEIKNMRLAEVKALSTISDSETVASMRRPNEVSFIRGNTAIASR